MANHVITVEVTLKEDGSVGRWTYTGEPELERKNTIESVIWELKATDYGEEEVPADRLCFAIPSNANGKWGVDIKPADRNVSGNSWLTDDEVRILNGNLRGRQPAPESASDQWPLEFIWDVNPRRIMRGVRSKHKKSPLPAFHCCQWVRVVDDRGRVFEDDPEVRFRSRF